MSREFRAAEDQFCNACPFVAWRLRTRKLEETLAVRRNLEFAGKVTLITEGNRGIGAATAKHLAEFGAHVVIIITGGRP